MDGASHDVGRCCVLRRRDIVGIYIGRTVGRLRFENKMSEVIGQRRMLGGACGVGERPQGGFELGCQQTVGGRSEMTVRLIRTRNQA